MVLTHAQWRVWFLARLDPGSAAYNESRAHRLTGSIDIEALRASLQSLVQRHEILRTTFTVIDDEPRQIVHEDGTLDFDCVDLSATCRRPAEMTHCRACLPMSRRSHSTSKAVRSRASV